MAAAYNRNFTVSKTVLPFRTAEGIYHPNFTEKKCLFLLLPFPYRSSSDFTTPLNIISKIVARIIPDIFPVAITQPPLGTTWALSRLYYSTVRRLALWRQAGTYSPIGELQLAVQPGAHEPRLEIPRDLYRLHILVGLCRRVGRASASIYLVVHSNEVREEVDCALRICRQRVREGKQGGREGQASKQRVNLAIIVM